MNALRSKNAKPPNRNKTPKENLAVLIFSALAVIMTRIERIAHEIKKEISRILREDVSDPRIGFVSLTDVNITPDLKYAKIFVSVLGDENSKKKTLKGLKSATSFIKLKLGEALDLRFIPDIKFVYDNSLERGSRILGLMDKLHKEQR